MTYRSEGGLCAIPRDTLVLMACGEAKLGTDTAVELADLYMGPMWIDLRKNGKAIPRRNIFVLSGGLGFRPAWSFSKPYNSRISAEKVDAMIERGIFEAAPSPTGKGATLPSIYADVFRDKPYQQVIVYGSGEYRRGFEWIVSELRAEGVIEEGAPVVILEGTLLQQRRVWNECLRDVCEAPRPAEDLTPEGIQLVIPGAERVAPPSQKQLDLF